MKTATEKDGMFYYLNNWHKEFGCKFPTFIDCNWIFTDKELVIFQEWINRRGE